MQDNSNILSEKIFQKIYPESEYFKGQMVMAQKKLIIILFRLY